MNTQFIGGSGGARSHVPLGVQIRLFSFSFVILGVICHIMAHTGTLKDSIGGSKGDVRDAPPPGVQILSFLCNRQKICKIIPIWEFAHPLGKILDPPLDHSYISRIYRCLCRGRSRISRRKARTYKFPKNCIKLRKFWSVGGGGARRGHLPLDPPLLCLDILFNV